MKKARLRWLILDCFLVGCSTTPSVITPVNGVRSRKATASVGVFLTISLDPSAQTITYTNHTNGETGTVPYSVNSDGTGTKAGSRGSGSPLSGIG